MRQGPSSPGAGGGLSLLLYWGCPLWGALDGPGASGHWTWKGLCCAGRPQAWLPGQLLGHGASTQGKQPVGGWQDTGGSMPGALCLVLSLLLAPTQHGVGLPGPLPNCVTPVTLLSLCGSHSLSVRQKEQTGVVGQCPARPARAPGGPAASSHQGPGALCSPAGVRGGCWAQHTLPQRHRSCWGSSLALFWVWLGSRAPVQLAGQGRTSMAMLLSLHLCWVPLSPW